MNNYTKKVIALVDELNKTDNINKISMICNDLEILDREQFKRKNERADLIKEIKKEVQKLEQESGEDFIFDLLHLLKNLK